tara:strand:+ start:132 stop:539 length:408 start_codon:yes stop_codon:yes gene_type:complete
MSIFTSTGTQVDRLLTEYDQHNKLIVAFDFDDTVFPYSDANNDCQVVIDLLKRCQERDFYLVCFTASSSDRYDFITEHMESKGIKVASINVNPIPLKFGHNGKIYFNILLDDRAGLPSAMAVLSEVLDTMDILYL